MKKIIVLAIMCFMTMNVFAMERELMPGSEKPFLVDADILKDINGLPNNFTITSEEFQSVSDILPDAPQWGIESELNKLIESGLLEPEHEEFFLGGSQIRDGNKKKLYTCYLEHNPDSNFQTKKLSDLRLHEYREHNIKTYVCMKLVIDKNINTIQEPYVCLERFATQDQRDIHIYGSGNHRYLCHICRVKQYQTVSELYDTVSELHNHFDRHHHGKGQNRGQRNACLLCEPYKTIPYEGNLYLHLKENHALCNR